MVPSLRVPRRHPADAEILRLAVPALGALVAEPLFLLADSAIIGHLGTPELAGLGIAATVLATAVTIFNFLAYGTTAAVARKLGAGDLAGSLRAGIDGCWLAVVVGLSVALVGWPLTPSVIGMFDTRAQVAEHAETYLRVSLLGIPAMLLVLAATGVLRGLQNTRTPLAVAVAGAVGNVGLNVAFVYGLGLGVAGSALGTVIAQAAMAATFVIVVVRAASRHDVAVRPRRSGVREAFGAGIPLIVRTLAVRIALLAATAVAAAMGTREMAAHQVAFNTWILLSLVLDALAIAAQALVGRALGAGDAAWVRSLTRRLTQWGVITGAALGVLVIVAGSLYARLFTPDPDVRSLLVTALVVLAVGQPIAGWVFVLDGVLIGAGDGRYLAWASVLSIAVFLPAAATVVWLGLSGHSGMTALWGAVNLWLVVRLLTLALRERRDSWLVLGA